MSAGTPPGSTAVAGTTAGAYMEPTFGAMTLLEGFIAPDSGPKADPRAVNFFFNDAPRTCSKVTSDPACGAHWQVSVAVPSALAHPGTISLSDPQIVATAVAGGTQPACTADSAALTTGTLEIVSLGDESMVKLTGTSTAGMPSDGTYTAQRCYPPPLALTALAIKRAKLPSNFGGEVGVVFSGPESDEPGTLYLFLGEAGATCGDPWLHADCKDHVELVVTIPPSLQAPGSVTLNDPRLNSTLMEIVKLSGEGAGYYGYGTLEIVSLDASKITVKISGTGQPSSTLADGTYTASICP